MSPAQPAKATATPYEGTLDQADRTSIRGWAWDKRQPDSPINVDIYDGENLLATVEAKVLRRGLLSKGKGNGQHGFRYATPDHLKDSKPHTIRVKVTGTDFELRNSPKVIGAEAL